MKKLLFVLILTSFAFSCKSDFEKREDQKREDLSNLIEELSCKSVEDCLSNYDFKSARSIAALSGHYDKEKYLILILNEESIYWAKNNDFNRAYNTIIEGKVHYFTSLMDDTNEFHYHKAQFTIIEYIVDKLLDTEDYRAAKKWALKLPDASYHDYWEKVYFKGDKQYDAKKSKVNSLLNKISQIEKLLN